MMNGSGQRPRYVLPLLIALAAISLIEVVSLFGGGRMHANDFKHLWVGTRVLQAGGSPYDAQLLMSAARQYGIDSINPYVYLPATGLFMWPFALLPFKPALLAWSALNWILAWASVLAGPLWARLNRPWRAQLIGACVLAGSMPFMRQMTAGQMNIVVLTAVMFAWGALARRRDTWAGVVLGLAAAFKIAPFFFILPLIGIKRFRAAGGLLAGFAGANLIAFLIFGPAIHAEAVPVLSQMGYGESTWANVGMDFYRDPFNQSINSLLHHLLAENPYTLPWINLGPEYANGLTWILSLALLAGFCLLLARYWDWAHGEPAWRELESSLFLASVLLMLLLPSLMWDHYALQALPVFFWLACTTTPERRGWRLAVIAASFILISIPWMHMADQYRSGAGILLMSIRLWGLLLLLLAVCIEADALLKARLKRGVA